MMTGTIKSFCELMKILDKIQCVLDIPLAQISLPDPLRCIFHTQARFYVTHDARNLNHGLVHGWNHTTYNIDIKQNVHQENFTVKGWGLLHHAGFLAYPHHDAKGSVTWVKMEFGIKFWIVF